MKAPLFRQGRTKQRSSGAYFTLPLAANIAARLTLDQSGPVDWTSPEVWAYHKVVDPACGSGILLRAMLDEMSRRAREQGATDERVDTLRWLAVEEGLVGLDVNAESLADAQRLLTDGLALRPRRTRLHLMPYGPTAECDGRVLAGALELLGEAVLVPQPARLFADDYSPTDVKVAAAAVKGARVVVMNPPFSSRDKMGGEFPVPIQHRLRARVDEMQGLAMSGNPVWAGAGSTTNLATAFTMLADYILSQDWGTLAMIRPTISATAPSGLAERRALAEVFHVDTILTSHEPKRGNLSQDTGINESIFVLTRK